MGTTGSATHNHGSRPSTNNTHTHPIGDFASQVDLDALIKRVTALEQAGQPNAIVSAYPAPTSTVQIPDTWDRTGGIDVSAAFVAWLEGVPSGTAANRKLIDMRGGILRMDQALKIHDKAYLDLANGTLRQNGSLTNENGSLIYTQWGNTALRIHDVTVIGNCPDPVATKGNNAAAGILMDGGTGHEVYNITAQSVWGDGIELNSFVNAHIWRYDIQSCGRNVVASIKSQNCTIEQGKSGSAVGYCVLDIEPNAAGESTTGLTFRDHTFAGWSNCFFAAEGSPDATIDGVTIERITGTGKWLYSVARLPNRKNFTLRDLQSDTPSPYTPFLLENIAGLRIVKDTINQPVAAGVALYNTTGSTVTWT